MKKVKPLWRILWELAYTTRLLCFEQIQRESSEARARCDALARRLKAKNPRQAMQRHVEFEQVAWLQRQLDAASQLLQFNPYSRDIQFAYVVLSRQLLQEKTALVFELSQMGVRYGTQ